LENLEAMDYLRTFLRMSNVCIDRYMIVSKKDEDSFTFQIKGHKCQKSIEFLTILQS